MLGDTCLLVRQACRHGRRGESTDGCNPKRSSLDDGFPECCPSRAWIIAGEAAALDSCGHALEVMGIFEGETTNEQSSDRSCCERADCRVGPSLRQGHIMAVLKQWIPARGDCSYLRRRCGRHRRFSAVRVARSRRLLQMAEGQRRLLTKGRDNRRYLHDGQPSAADYFWRPRICSASDHDGFHTKG